MLKNQDNLTGLIQAHIRIPGANRDSLRRFLIEEVRLTPAEGEALADYFRRVLALCPPRRGMIFSPQLRPGEHAEAMDTWHRLQDELWD